jgi:RES domain-containing protein
MVYTSEHPALAALEILNSWESYAALTGYHLYRCTFEDGPVLEAPSALDIQDKVATRAYGDAWITNRDSIMLKVRSVAAPESTNYLLNPNHPDFLSSVALEALGPFNFDERIEKLMRKAKQ